MQQARKGLGKAPLDVLTPALRPEVECLLAQRAEERRGSVGDVDDCGVAAPTAPGAKDERASTRVILGGAGASSAPEGAAAAPHLLTHDEPAGSQLPTCKGGGEGSFSEGYGGPPVKGGSISGRLERVCAMCGGPPSAAGDKLKACGACISAHYCSPECQKQHWGEGGHKQACLQLQERRERRKGGAAGVVGA